MDLKTGNIYKIKDNQKKLLGNAGYILKTDKLNKNALLKNEMNVRNTFLDHFLLKNIGRILQIPHT